MTFTTAGSLTNAENAVAATSTTFSLTANTAGNFILASFANDTQYTSNVVSNRVTWTNLTGNYSFTAAPHNQNIWLGTVNSAGADTLTVTYAASMAGGNSRFDAREFHSTLGNLVLDKTGTVNAAGSHWATLTPAYSGELYWGWCENSGSTSTSGTPADFVFEADSHSNAEGYCLSVSAAYTPIWNDSGQIAGLMVLVAEGIVTSSAVPPFVMDLPNRPAVIPVISGWRNAGHSR